jgi:hypothetical protein
MMCSVAGLFFHFDLTPMLKSAGVDDERISEYQEGILFKVAEELLLVNPNLHPEAGLPDVRNIRTENLLGPNSDWEQVCSLSFIFYILV